MQQVFSPKQVARALGASESSVKRWCDRGVLPSIKTAGGHRRLPIAGILEFLRGDGRALLDPTAIGLPAGMGARHVPARESRDQFKTALVSGDYATCQRILYDVRVSGDSLTQFFDHVIATTMHEVGDDWCDGELEVFQERRGCELLTRLLCEVRSTLPAPKPDAPLAMGGAVEHDPYSLPNRMVEVTLTQLGWNATSLGDGIPMRSLTRAIQNHQPRLFWISASAIPDESTFLREFAELSTACGTKTALVLGGRALTEELRKKMQFTVYCENLERLESFANVLHPNTEKTDDNN